MRYTCLHAGYCKASDKTGVSFGLSAVQLTCEDYQALIDRGWRRSGKFIYKPIMHEVMLTCYIVSKWFLYTQEPSCIGFCISSIIPHSTLFCWCRLFTATDVLSPIHDTA